MHDTHEICLFKIAENRIAKLRLFTFAGSTGRESLLQILILF